MSKKNTAAPAAADNIVTTERFQWSDLWKKDDWQAIWIGFILILITAVSVITGAFDFSAAKFKTWGNGVSLFEQFSGSLAGHLILTLVVLGVLFGVGSKLKGVPGEAALAGAGVSYCAVCDGAFYTGKDVLVVGGGDTAVEDALYLASICRHVAVALRRDQFRGARTRVEALLALENVECLPNTTVTEILGEDHVKAVRLACGAETREQAVDGVFIAVGTRPSTAYLADLPVLTPEGYVRADETGTTEVPGLFAAGDIREKALRQVVTAVADGANAVHSAVSYLNRKGSPVF